MENTKISAQPAELTTEEKKALFKRRFYDIVFIFGFLCSLIPGPFPQLSGVASIGLLFAAFISFFDDNLYMYTALFIYLRYRLLIGDFAAFRAYTFILVLRFLKDLHKIKFQAIHLPALFVFFLHCMFVVGRQAYIKLGLYVLADCVVIYIIMCIITQDKKLMHRFLFAFMLGAIASGIYGWTSDLYSVDINISGAGAHTVTRNFGALSDSNFAGLIYSLCVVCALTLKELPIWLRGIFLALFGIMLLQTASLSAMLTLTILIVFLIILKYRSKAFFILLFAFVGTVIVAAILLSIPQFRRIDAIAGLLIRFEEKVSYISRGRLDLLTTGRSAIWADAVQVLKNQGLWSKLIGGKAVTVSYIDPKVMSIACHNSYLQSLINFGLLGTLLIYIPLFFQTGYRILRHFSQKQNYYKEDLCIMQIIFALSFIVFGGTVDFFIDWVYMMLYFI